MKIKKILFIVFIFTCFPILLSSKVKVVHLPDNIKIEENSAKEIVVRNMSEVDIYKCHYICIIDDFIYLSTEASSEVIKFSLEGEIFARVGRMGQGPGEFLGIGDVTKFKENIAIVDAYKAVICNKNLEILKEIKLNDRFMNLILARPYPKRVPKYHTSKTTKLKSLYISSFQNLRFSLNRTF